MALQVMPLEELIALLRAEKSEAHPFQTVIHASLLMEKITLRGLASGSPSDDGIARSILKELLLSPARQVENHSNLTAMEVIALLGRPVLAQIESPLVQPLGGMLEVLSSMSLNEHEKQRQGLRESNKLKLSLMDCVVKGIMEDADLVKNLDRVAYAMREDVLGFGVASYGKAIQDKRLQKAAETDFRRRVVGISRSSFFNVYGSLNSESALAYFIDDFIQRAIRCVGAQGNYFSPDVMDRWVVDHLFGFLLAEAFSGYEFVRRKLLAEAPDLEFVKNWVAVPIKDVSGEAVPRFTEIQVVDAYGHI